jgi:hypothetical protein
MGVFITHFQVTYPIAEGQRQESLISYNILDTAPEADYEAIVDLISQITDMPMAGVSLVDGNRVWFKARKGMELTEIDRATSFCSHVILSDQLFVVEDALLDERFLKNKKVIDDPKIRFYAAMPLITPDGYSLGALCVGDNKTRVLSAHQRTSLVTLSRCVVSLLEYRKMQGIVRELLKIMNPSEQTIEIVSAANEIENHMRTPVSLISFAVQTANVFGDESVVSQIQTAAEQVQHSSLRLYNVAGHLQKLVDQKRAEDDSENDSDDDSNGNDDASSM